VLMLSSTDLINIDLMQDVLLDFSTYLTGTGSVPICICDCNAMTRRTITYKEPKIMWRMVILWCSVCLCLTFVTFFVKKYFFSAYQL